MSNSLNIVAIATLGTILTGCASDPKVVAAHYSAEQARFEAHKAIQQAVYQNQHPIVEFTAFPGKPIKIEAASLKVYAPIQSGGSFNQPLAPTQQYVNPDAQAFASVVNTAMPFLGGMGLLWAGKSLVNAATSPLQSTATSGFNALTSSNTNTANVGQAGITGVANTATAGFAAQTAIGQAGLNTTAATAQSGITAVTDTASAGLKTTAATAQSGLTSVQAVSTNAINNTTGIATQAIDKIETAPVVVVPPVIVTPVLQ